MALTPRAGPRRLGQERATGTMGWQRDLRRGIGGPGSRLWHGALAIRGAGPPRWRRRLVRRPARLWLDRGRGGLRGGGTSGAGRRHCPPQGCCRGHGGRRWNGGCASSRSFEASQEMYLGAGPAPLARSGLAKLVVQGQLVAAQLAGVKLPKSALEVRSFAWHSHSSPVWCSVCRQRRRRARSANCFAACKRPAGLSPTGVRALASSRPSQTTRWAGSSQSQ